MTSVVRCENENCLLKDKIDRWKFEKKTQRKRYQNNK